MQNEKNEIAFPRWISVDEALPKPCADVLVSCDVHRVDGVKWSYVCIAQWIPRFCDEAVGINWDVECTEYNEENDEYYPFEGWYESINNWDDYSLIGIADFVTAWMPLPYPNIKEGNDERSGS